MIAVETGLIGLDQNVRDVIPELKDVKVLVGFEDAGEGNPRKPILRDVREPITMRYV